LKVIADGATGTACFEFVLITYTYSKLISKLNRCQDIAMNRSKIANSSTKQPSGLFTRDPGFGPINRFPENLQLRASQTDRQAELRWPQPSVC